MPAYSEERKLEKDTIDQLNEATQGLRQPARLAVYHYSASVSRQFHGPVQHDGVITCPVIAGPEGYSAAKALIASKHGAHDPLQVQVNSLSFIGETVGGVV